MIYYLRDKDNNTILDVEVYCANEGGFKFVELHSSIIIDNYSLFLLSIIEKEKQFEFIDVMDELSQLRGWLWEVYQKNETKNYEDIKRKVKEMLLEVAKEFDLYYVED